MKNKIMILILILLIMLFVALITFLFNKMVIVSSAKNDIENPIIENPILDTTKIDIEKILESNIILDISEIHYGPDIDLYSTRDKYGNEWIYRRTSKHIVLTNNGILCQYTFGSYCKEIKYSRM